MTDRSHQEKPLDYPAMIDEAMRGVVTAALRQVSAYGLPGDHHFYISFSTAFPGVRVSPQLKERFPNEMTIVMQHQFWDLDVAADRFSITLSFNNVPEKLVVPYAALTAFADPSIKFGLQFHAPSPANRGGMAEMAAEPGEAPSIELPEGEALGAQILSLDAFRKK